MGCHGWRSCCAAAVAKKLPDGEQSLLANHLQGGKLRIAAWAHFPMLSHRSPIILQMPVRKAGNHIVVWTAPWHRHDPSQSFISMVHSQNMNMSWPPCSDFLLCDHTLLLQLPLPQRSLHPAGLLPWSLVGPGAAGRAQSSAPNSQLPDSPGNPRKSASLWALHFLFL